MRIGTAVAALGASAQDGRLEAFRPLFAAGAEGLAAGDLARRLGVPPSTLSANIAILGHAGLVASRRDGCSVIHTILAALRVRPEATPAVAGL